MSTLNRRQSFVALDNLVADIALVLDSWKLWQGTIVTVLHFLSTVQILDVSRVPTATSATAVITGVLVHLPVWSMM